MYCSQWDVNAAYASLSLRCRRCSYLAGFSYVCKQSMTTWVGTYFSYVRKQKTRLGRELAVIL